MTQINNLEIPPQEADLLRHCPNCKTYHMVSNRKRDYCSDWCADTHYNKNRRLIKQLSINNNQMNKDSSNYLKSDIQILQVPERNDQESLRDKKVKISMEILNSLNIDLVKGSLYYLEPLLKFGLDFAIFDAKYKLHNTPAGTDCYYMELKNYQVFLIKNTEILIIKK